MLLVIPVSNAPHKPMPGDTPRAEDRLAMTRLAFSGLENVVVSDIEVSKKGISYTSDTILELRKKYPEEWFYLVMGADMFLSLDSWRSVNRIFSNTVPVVLARREDDRVQIAKYAEKLKDELKVDSVILNNEVVEISSTELRDQLRSRIRGRYIDDTIYEYIIAEKLYGAKPDFDWLREKAIEMLLPKRVPHVLGCEQEAVRLAERWGADVDEAREAAILHDVTKKLNLAEQLQICRHYDIMTDAIEENEAKLLHSKTGAAIARGRFAASDAVFDAIMWHTTGRADMSLLEKIIYMADYIEPTRDFDGVDELRSLAYSDLDKSVFAGLKMSIDDMEARGIVPHPRSLEAMRFYE